QLRLYGLAHWATRGHSESLPPAALFLQDPHGAEHDSVRRELDSLLSFEPLAASQLDEWLRSWWTANGLVALVAELPAGLDLAGIAAAWAITPADVDQASRFREDLRRGIRRIQNT